MNTSEANIYHLKEDLKALEFELMEEQFHYKSIPDRQKNIKISKTIHIFIILLTTPVFLYFLFVTIVGFTSALNKSSAILSLIISPLLCILTGGMVFVLIYNYVREYITGYQSSQFFYAANLTEELQASARKIQELTLQINDVKQQLDLMAADNSGNNSALFANSRTQAEGITAPKQNPNAFIPSLSMPLEEFFLYVYGVWGIEKEDLLFKLSLGSYQEEKQKLTKEIIDTNTRLSQLAEQIAEIDNQYFNAKQTVIYYRFALFCLLLCFLACFEMPVVRIATLLITLLLIFSGTRIRKNFKMAKIKYKVEHHYEENRNFADVYNLSPVAVQKEPLLVKLSGLKHRLQFITFLLDYAGQNPGLLENK